MFSLLVTTSSQFSSCSYFSSRLKQFDTALALGAITIHLSEPRWAEGFILTCQLRFSNKMYFYCATIIPQQNISWAVQPRRINCLNAARQLPHVFLLNMSTRCRIFKMHFWNTERHDSNPALCTRRGKKDDYFLFLFFFFFLGSPARHEQHAADTPKRRYS